jgi:hypothetical protein
MTKMKRKVRGQRGLPHFIPSPIRRRAIHFSVKACKGGADQAALGVTRDFILEIIILEALALPLDRYLLSEHDVS